MDISQLNTYEKDLFASIHNTILPKRTQNFDTKAFSPIFFNISGKITTIIEPIMEKTKQILDMFNKTNYDLSQYYIEFHQRNCGFEKNIKRTFDWHTDDYGAGPFKVYTIIYYIRKDNTIKGGNLEYIFENKNYIQQIKKEQILCFDGNLKHRPEICSGIGCRDSIVVFIKSAV
jgi:hypothetical protein